MFAAQMYDNFGRAMGHQSSWLSDRCFLTGSDFVFHLWKEDKTIEQICSNMIVTLVKHI